MKVTQIKHMTFAVRDAEKTLDRYKRLLGAPEDAFVKTFPKSRTKAAVFDLGEIEFQISESMDPDGRFSSWINQRGHEGLHHICFAVEDIDAALEEAQANGATLKECASCKVKGSHAHPEGWVAFLEDEVSGIEIEFMQVYKEGEGQDRPKGI